MKKKPEKTGWHGIKGTPHMRLAHLLMSLLFLFIFCCVCTAVEPQPANMSQRVVKVGFFPFDGYHIIKPDGERSGYGYDYLQHLRRYANWRYEYTSPDREWPDMLSMLRTGKIDLITYAGKTPNREAEFAFSRRPTIHVSTVMTVRAGENRYHQNDYKNWNGIRVGIIKDSSQNVTFSHFAQEKGFSFQPVWFSNTQELLKGLLEKKNIDAIVTTSLRDITGSEWIYEQFNAAPMYAIVRKADKALLKELDDAMEQLDMQSPDLREKLRRSYYLREQTGKLSFTPKESAYIDQMRSSGKPLTVILNPDRKPFSWYENGEYHGLFKDFADEISKRTDLAFRFVPVADREEFMKKRLSPEIDIIFDTVMDFPRAEKDHLILSEPYFSVSFSILRDKSAGNRIRTVSVLEPSDLAKQVRSLIPEGANIRICKTMKDLLAEVSSDTSDAAYLYTRSAEYAAFEDKQNRLVSNYVPSLEQQYCIGVRDDRNPALFSILNKAVLSLDESFIQKTRIKYTPQLKGNYSLRRFILQHPWFSIGVPCVILLLICGYLWVLISRRKYAYRTGVMFNKLPLRCFVLNAKGRILHFTMGEHSTLLDKTVLRTLDDIPDNETRQVMREKLASALKTGKQETAEFTFDGTYRSAIISKLPDSVFGSNTAIWISQDITELQASREETQRHEEFFHLTLNSIGDGVIASDAVGNVLLLNPVAEHLIGIAGSEAKGKPHEEIFRIVSALDGSIVTSPLRKALDSGTIVELGNHTDLLSFNGKRYHIADSAGPIRNRQGEIIGAILTFRDVTETYRRREELRESVANWEAASDIALLQPFRMNIQTRQVFGDLKRLDGFWPVTNGKAVAPHDWLVPEDADRCVAEYGEFLQQNKSSFIMEYKAGRNGKIRYFRQYGRRDKEKPEILVGLIQDITTLTEAELQRNAVQSMWKLVIDTMPFMLFIKSAEDDFRFLQCNRKFSEFVGREPEDVLNHTDAELFTRPEDAEAFRDWDRKVMDGGVSLEYNESPVNARGELRHIRTVKMPFHDADGKAILIGLSMDVTELEDQREHLAQINARLEAVQNVQQAQLDERTATNDCLSIFMNSDYMQVPFEQILEVIRHHLGASHCYALQIDPVSCTEICLAEATAEGRDALVASRPPVAFNPSDEWYTRLREKHLLNWADLSSPDACTWFHGRWDSVIAQHDLRSLWLAAVSCNGKMWGTLGVAYDERSERKFSEADEAFVRSAARMVDLILMRIENRDNLIKTKNELATALEKAQSADRAKSFFIASVSHEIRTPLNAVIGFSELLRNGNVPEADADEYLESISYAGNALLQLINDVLDLSKLEADQMKIEPEPASLREMGEEVMKVFQYQAMNRGVSLVVDIPEMPDLMLDQMRIRQILFNLIGNAVKFTLQGSVTLKAECFVNDDKSAEVSFSVTDTGIGIAPEDQKKLMEPFVQLSNMRGTNSGNSGTGLGLSISKRLLEKMGGSLWLKSEEGKGSTFGASLHHVTIAEDHKSENSAHAVHEKQEKLEKLSVLIVDDVGMNLKVMKALCRKVGVVDVETAQSGEDALAVLDRKRFDLILTDMWMPGMNGSELAEKIHADERFQALSVVAVTADVEAKDNFPLDNFSGVLLKPITLEKMHKMIEIALNSGGASCNYLVINELRE